MADVISAGVGVNQPNLLADVETVQTLLNEHLDVIGAALTVDGVWGLHTLAAVEAYQSTVVKMALPDGVLSPNGPTFASLAAADVALNALAAPAGVPALLAPQAMPVSVLTDADYAAAAATLGCEVAAIKAVSSVETAGKPFDAEGRPTILYEQRYFSRLTNHIYDASHPDISSMATGGYGLLSAQYPKIIEAASLDLDKALRSASWGAFQIMGDNCTMAGFATPEAMVAAMRSGVSAHLEGFVSFVAAKNLTSALVNHDWTAFAIGYNGSGGPAAGYPERLETEYAANL